MCSTTGIAIRRAKSWIDDGFLYLNKYLPLNQILTRDESDPEENLQVAQSNYDESTENVDVFYLCHAESTPIANQSLRNPNELSTKTLPGMVVSSSDFETMSKNCTDRFSCSSFALLKDMKDQLEEIQKMNSTQFGEMRKTIERNKVQYNKQYMYTEKMVEKNYKDVQDAMKLQHRETRRRLERLENKTNSGYFH